MPLPEGFFSSQNELSLDSLEDGSWRSPLAAPLRAWLHHSRSGDAYFPHLLPFVKHGQAILWAFGASPRSTRDIGVTLAAFLGPRELPYPLPLPVPNDGEAGTALLSANVRETIRWTVKDPMLTAKAISSVMCLLQEQPRRKVVTLPPTGRLLRDFELALEFGPRDEAPRLLDRLEQERRLDAFNIHCLRVRELAVRGRWSDIVGLPSLRSLLQAPRRPAPVTWALAEACYRTHFPDLRDAADVDEILTKASTITKEDRWDELFQGQAEAGQPTPYLELHALFAFSQNRAARALEFLPEATSSSPFFAALHARIVAEPHQDEDPALESTAPEAVSTQKVTQHLFEAVFGGHPETVIREALEAVDALEAVQRAEFFESEASRNLFQQARTRVERGPSSWLAWIRSLQSTSSVQAQSSLERNAGDWMGEFSRSPELGSRMAEAIDRLDSTASRTFEACFPLFIKAISPEEGPVRGTTAVLKVLLERITVEPTVAVLGAAFELVSSMLSLGLSEDEYGEMLLALELLWERLQSPSTIPWLVDVLDLLTSWPCRDKAGLGELFWKAVGSYERHRHRLKPAILAAIAMIAGDLGFEDALVEQVADGDRALEPISLKGKVIGIYTLVSTADTHLEARLVQRYPGVKVRFDHSFVSTNSLKSLARNADIFVTVTGAAKHSATDAIARARGQRGVLFPTGKGMSSILQAIEDHLAVAAEAIAPA